MTSKENNLKRVQRFDQKLERSGGIKLNGIRVKPENNIFLFYIESATGWSKTEIVNRAIPLLYESIKK